LSARRQPGIAGLPGIFLRTLLRRLEPQSFRGLLIIGFSLVSLPLILALVTNAIAVKQIAVHSEDALQQAMRANRLGHQAAVALASMNRSAQLIAADTTPARLAAYERDRDVFMVVLSELRAMPFAGPDGPLIDGLVAEEEKAYRALRAAVEGGAGCGAGMSGRVEDFPALAARGQRLVELGERRVYQEIGYLRDHVSRARWLTGGQLLELLPILILLAGGFVALIARPIREVNAAIGRIGAGDLAAPVVVAGTRDLQQLGRRIDWLRQRLAETDQQKNRFLRQVSHELKTPLTALREGSALLSEGQLGALTARQQEVVDILRASGDRLQAQIEELLAYGEAEFRRGALNIAPVEVRRVVARVLDDHNLALRARHLRVVPEVDDVMVDADAEKLRVMIDNLLSNAIRHSPDGGLITIRVAGGRERIAIEVSDQGEGIPPAERQHVFEPFFRGGRVDGPRRVRPAGSGIGLSVVS
jgi:two-component system sensor histidine kinase GlrK